jgi:Ser/Thr protein kinase RdoA (MazF antagonist)
LNQPDTLVQIANHFNTNGPVLAVQEYGTGNVNDTYLVTLDTANSAPGVADHFILQRINQHVFRQPELIMVNMRLLSEHVHARLQRERDQRRWEVPRVFSTREGQHFHRAENGSFWRAMSFIDHSNAYPRIQDTHHANEAGYALGRFQSLISDMPIEQLHDTLVGFHITPRYLQHYDEVVQKGVAASESVDVRHCKAFVEEHRYSAGVLEEAKASGRLPLRPMHGDPKIDNIMIDEVTRRAVSIIDLDTVKPGLVHYDIGDCLRSCCNPLGEETTQLEQVRFEMDLCCEILRGYLSIAASFFTSSDYAYIYDSIRLIAFELGLRFFTDYLEGNVYFKARHAEHNLQRALVQFKLAASVEQHEPEIRQMVTEFGER